MIIIAGTISVDPDARAEYLEAHHGVVDAARKATGCLDFSLSADLLEADRINVYERWESTEDVERFRGDGPSPEGKAPLRSADVLKYNIASTEAP